MYIINFYRYDGLYKVVKYYPETGISGFTVWRFVLRRDDPIPAPWTAQGKKRIAQLGLQLIVSCTFHDVINRCNAFILKLFMRFSTLKTMWLLTLRQNQNCKVPKEKER